jgi:predicted RNA-binding protein associated with RNAse of E/G family
MQQPHGWYVNLEATWRRTTIGFDTQDLVLDVTVADDLSSWAWKDEDELAWSVSVGKYSPQQAEQIRGEGVRVMQALEARLAVRPGLVTMAARSALAYPRATR